LTGREDEQGEQAALHTRVNTPAESMRPCLPAIGLLWLDLDVWHTSLLIPA